MSYLTVIEGGPRTTVEDLGRAMVGRFGVPRGGAFDPLALIAANRLVGNDDGDAGLEFALRGPDLRHDGAVPLALALTGAQAGAEIEGSDGRVRCMPLGSTAVLEPGERLRCGLLRDGARGWLAVGGGIAVPSTLGARSTCAPGSFGGFAGRALRAGDALPLGPARRAAADASWSGAPPLRAAGAFVLRILPGPQAGSFGGDALAALESRVWRVAPATDRRGIRVRPEADSQVPSLPPIAGIAPEGTTLGAIQATPDGGAIILGPDRPVTGGYAKPACVIAADLPTLARLRPGDRVRFCRIALDEACRMLRRAREALPPRPR